MNPPRPEHVFLLTLLCLSCAGLSAQNNTDVVYPGDVNNNGVVNGVDILLWGGTYGSEGPARDSVSTIWQPWPAPADWGDTIASLSLDKHFADCNGDGIVDEADLPAFEDNDQLQHGNLFPDIYPTGQPGTHPELRFEMPPLDSIIMPGDSLTLPLLLGDETVPVPGLHGISFSIELNGVYVSPDGISFDFTGADWLGDGADITIIQTWDGTHTLNITITKTNGINTSGFGEVGRLFIVIEGNVPDYAPEPEIIELGKTMMVSAEMKPIPTTTLGPQSLRLGVGPYAPDTSEPGDGDPTGPITEEEEEPEDDGMAEAGTDLARVGIHPNPVAHGRFYLTNLPRDADLRLIDPRGQASAVDFDKRGIHTNHLPGGLYLLDIRAGDQRRILKVIIPQL